MLFDIESFDYSYFNEGSEGLKLALVHHLDMPIMRQKGFHIAPGTENQIAVTPTLMTTSANAMSRFVNIKWNARERKINGFVLHPRLSPDLRNCYSDDEISLKYLPRKDGYRFEHIYFRNLILCKYCSRYEMSNCLFEATFEKILEECKVREWEQWEVLMRGWCVYNGQCAPDFHQTGGELAIETMEVCSGDSLHCMNHFLNRMGS